MKHFKIGQWLGILLASAWIFLQQMHAAEFEAHIFTNALGQTMPYRLLPPKDRQSEVKYPLVLLFHGAGERGQENQRQLVHGTQLFLSAENRDQFRAFVFVPQCPDAQQWVDMPWGADCGERPSEPSAAMKLALGILDELVVQGNVDTSRLYVTGLSMGGYAAWDCLTRYPGRFAAGAPVCGGGDEDTVTPAVAQVPVWAFHSEDDTTVKVQRTRRMIEAMRAVGGKPRYSEYAGLGHNSWDRAYGEGELLPWMFAQRRGRPDTYSIKTLPPTASSVAPETKPAKLPQP